MLAKGARRNTGSPSGDRQGPPATREGQAGPCGVAESSVVPRKMPGEGRGLCAWRRDRSALDAVRHVHKLINAGHREIVDADLSSYFDWIPNAELLKSVARRVVDLLMAMARELVTERGIGENAEPIWRSLQEQNESIGHAGSSLAESVAEVEIPTDNETIASPQEPLPAVIDQLLLFGASLSAASGRKPAARRSSSRLSRVD